MSGIWQFNKPFGSGVALQYIWQECLKMTISGMSGPNHHGQLHHMIHDGKYFTEDKMGDQFKHFYVDNTVQGYEYRLNDGESLEVAVRFLGSMIP